MILAERLEIFHAKGETDDASWVWIESTPKVLGTHLLKAKKHYVLGISLYGVVLMLEIPKKYKDMQKIGQVLAP